MNKVTVSFAAVLLGFVSGQACAGTGISPIRQIEVQTIDIAIPEMLLAELRRQPAKMIALKNKTPAADSKIIAVADHRILP